MNDPEEHMELATLLDQARTASPGQRIEWRDRIVAHGPDAIEGVRPWLADDVLAAFAVRVIEHAGLAGNDELAAKVLRGAKKKAPISVAGDIDWALRHLREAQRAPVTQTATRTGTARGTARREAPRFTVAPRRRAR